MGWLEEEFLQKKWNGVQPKLWRRYIDDIFFLWSGSVDDLESFITELNNHHSHIKFTAIQLSGIYNLLHSTNSLSTIPEVVRFINRTKSANSPK